MSRRRAPLLVFGLIFANLNLPKKFRNLRNGVPDSISKSGSWTTSSSHTRCSRENMTTGYSRA